MSRSGGRRYGWLTAVLLAGAALRLVGLVSISPPGPSHDEVANWLIDRAILDLGDYAVFYPAAYGHEAGFHYWQAAFVALIGDNLLALRLPAAFAGLLGVAVVYALGRRLWSHRPGLMAAALLALLYYPVFFSRQGLRAISLPLVAGAAAYLWWRAWERAEEGDGRAAFLLAGAMAGLALYTYSAARVVPIFFGGYVVYLGLFHREALRRRRVGVALFIGALTAVALPLAGYLLANPSAEFRVAEVSGPLAALRAGDWRPVVANLARLALGFGIEGDPLWRHNIAGQPIFSLAWAALFYIGVGLALYRMRDMRFAFVLLWLLTALIPSAVTIDAPSFIRISNSLVVLTLFPAIVMHNFAGLSPIRRQLSTGIGKILGIVTLAILYSWTLDGTIRDTFRIWPQHPEVQFVWQAALTEVAGHIEQQEVKIPTAVGGWTPDSMDRPTMALLAPEAAPALRHFDPRTALVLPASEGVLYYPTALPPPPPLADFLREIGSPILETPLVTGYRVWAADAWPEEAEGKADFGGELRLLRNAHAVGCLIPDEMEPCAVLTVWRVLAPPDGARRFFLHDVVGETIVRQADRLDAPAMWWQRGDVVVQWLSLPPRESGPSGRFRLGVYDPVTGERLTTERGETAVDFVINE